MLDGSHYYECSCGSSEHTLKFILDFDRYGEGTTDHDPMIYTEVYLNDWQPLWKRIWVAVRYVFGYRCRYGHWDCFNMRPQDAVQLRDMLDTFINASEKQKGEKDDVRSEDRGQPNDGAPEVS